MTTSKHTPPPYRQGSSHGDRLHMAFANGCAVFVCEPDYRALPNSGEREQQEATCAFIVRACNGWNDINALRERLAELEIKNG